MTEEEAKTKWCPMTRIGFVMNAPDDTYVAATGNRITSLDDECNCIASDCMLGCDLDGNWLGKCGLRK